MTTEMEQVGEDMSERETLSLLTTTGHGVLSMGNDDRGYGVPVSFGYDGDNERFLFEFLNIGESKKRRFARASEEVTLTVAHFEDPGAWESAIVTGTIHSIDASDLSELSVSSFVLQGVDGAEEIRWAGADELEREWYEIRPTSISGRRRGGGTGTS